MREIRIEGISIDVAHPMFAQLEIERAHVAGEERRQKGCAGDRPNRFHSKGRKKRPREYSVNSSGPGGGSFRNRFSKAHGRFAAP
jgi:hypothetical protein